jgi:peptidoglycan biosynthesis protein MviN/MurJ (putative lipid II flippase)
VRIALIAFVLNAAFSWLFAFPLKLGAMGLMLANTVSALVSVFLSILWLSRKIGRFPLRDLLDLLARVAVACLVMGAVLWGGMRLMVWKGAAFSTRAFWLCGWIALSGLVFFAIAAMMKIPELDRLRDRLLSRLRRRRS